MTSAIAPVSATTGLSGALGSPRGYAPPPPLRPQPMVPDPAQDMARCNFVAGRWHQQDDVLRSRDRQIEENIRMLCGQQWTVWNPALQKFIDVQHWFGDPDRYWRQRPVVNRLLYWFILTHARMTENPSVVSFSPNNPDQMSADLAEAMDTLYKIIWQSAGMDDACDMRAAWMIPCGESYLLSRIDPARGKLKPWIGPAMLPLQDQLGQQVHYPSGHPNAGQPVEMYAQAVPYDATGNPLAQLNADGTYQVTGQPNAEPEGEIVVDALCALQVRGEWSQRPWHRKKWHMMFAYVSCEEILESMNVEVTPEQEGTSGTQFELSRILHGSGWYGAMGGRAGEGVTTFFRGGFAGVYTYWERPSRAFPQTEDSPGGRMIICTKNQVLYDGPRNAAFMYTSPLRQYKFVNLPGRPGATTPQEAMNPLQRQYNRGWGQIMEYRNLCVNPVGIIDQASGIRDKEIVNKPGLLVTAIKRPGVRALEYVDPPKLGEEVFRTQQLLRQELQDFGNIDGAEGSAPTVDASGALVQELRVNSDRFIGPTQRRAVMEDARLVEDHIALAKIIYDEERIFTFVGEDNIAQTVAIYPDMFDMGQVKVIPVIESALPEGRGERIKNAMMLYQAGVWGLPGGQDPQANAAFLKMARFPHMGRSQMLSGNDQVTANRENGQLALGAMAQMILTYEWYDQNVHIAEHTKFMAGPEFKRLPQMAQIQFAIHLQQHKLAAQQQEQEAFIQQVARTRAMAAAAEPVKTTVTHNLSPTPPAATSGTN